VSASTDPPEEESNLFVAPEIAAPDETGLAMTKSKNYWATTLEPVSKLRFWISGSSPITNFEGELWLPPLLGPLPPSGEEIEKCSPPLRGGV